MSGSDPPSGPPRDNRTVIRPNPGGRRVTSQPAPPDAAWPPQAPSPAQTPQAPRQPATARAPEAAAGSAAAILETAKLPSPNPMLKAAGPLLLMLGRLRSGLARTPSSAIMEKVARNIEAFERELHAAGYTADQVQVAKYVLSATADDIVQNMPVDDRQLWTQYSMLSQFFGERTGGVRFFEELTRMKADPGLNIDVLELMHACLALGFEGVYRTSPNGVATLQQVQREVYDLIRRVRPYDDAELSPRWRGLEIAAPSRRVRIPFWAVASVAAGLLFGTFLVLRTLLSFQSAELVEAMLQLHPATPLTIVRAEPAPPPPPPPPPPVERETQLERIRNALSEEIEAQVLDAHQTANEIFITIGNVSLFELGSDTVLDSFRPVARRIAETLDSEPGSITIIGHTDNLPITGQLQVRFPSNQELSVARAESVGELFQPVLSDPDRLTIEGRGELRPIASNDTPEGRARNRRVEVMIPRDDG